MRKKKRKEEPERSDRARAVRVALALTPEEYSRLEAAADAEGLAAGTYARVVLFRALRSTGSAASPAPAPAPVPAPAPASPQS
jgi:hypothetical protein